ncbi:MAG TPA: methionine--tRNA ligase [Pseudonocardiaceae bacterium]
MTGTVFVSTTIPYVNARPHLGHAFEFVQADALALHAAQQGRQVLLTSGTDENGLKNVQSALDQELPTATLVARNAAEFARLLVALDVPVDRFVRTSVDPGHRAGASEMWRLLAERGDIYSRTYDGQYCVGCEEFLASAELADGRCPIHRQELREVRERNYFFRLSRYQDAIMTALVSGEMRIWPEFRRNEMLGMLKAGLSDISVSRPADRAHGWGIPVPGDDGQVIYVWIDALTNYVNALGWAGQNPDYRRYWHDASRRIHLLGKDVTRFHAIYWPAILLSANLPLPTDLVVHGHVTLSGQKLSKSLGTVVDPFDLVSRYGAEAVRFLLLAEFSPWSDSDFSHHRLVARYNTDLANGLGNLVDRVTGLLHRCRAGVVPEVGSRGPRELSLLDSCATASREFRQALDQFDHRRAVAHLWRLVHKTNAYISQREPWTVSSTVELDTILHDLAGALRTVALLLGPILPTTATAMLSTLGMTTPEVGVDGLGEARVWVPGVARSRVSRPPHLFPRLELTW